MQAMTASDGGEGGSAVNATASGAANGGDDNNEWPAVVGDINTDPLPMLRVYLPLLVALLLRRWLSF